MKRKNETTEEFKARDPEGFTDYEVDQLLKKYAEEAPAGSGTGDGSFPPPPGEGLPEPTGSAEPDPAIFPEFVRPGFRPKPTRSITLTISEYNQLKEFQTAYKRLRWATRSACGRLKNVSTFLEIGEIIKELDRHIDADRELLTSLPVTN